MNNIINLYLEAAEVLFVLIGAVSLILGGLMCDGPMFDQAMQFIWFGVPALAGGAICQMLKELPKH